MSRRIFVLLASHSNNWLIRGYSTYKQSKSIISNNNIPNMSANCADYSNGNNDKNIIHNVNKNFHSIQIPTDKNKNEMQHAVAGIDFSSSFSDDTSMKEIEDEDLEDDDMELSVTFSDDEALLQMLDSRTCP